MAETDFGKFDIGVVGLDGLGAPLAQNISSHLFQVAACDPRPRLGAPSGAELTKIHLAHAHTLLELASMLRRPRTIFIFGDPDTVIDQLLPHLAPFDLLIDAGESYFKDIERRAQKVLDHSVEFMCVGIAGGESAARHGAMIMAGGRRETYARTRPLLEALAANFKGRPSVGYLGSAGAACFARMVHDGVEYALMKLVSEIFDLMQRILALTDEQSHQTPLAWHISVLKGHLAEISGHLIEPADEGTERRQIRHILDAAKSDPAARCISQTARQLDVATPTIDVALGVEECPARERHRSFAQTPHRLPCGRFGNDPESVLDELTGAFYAAMIVTYAQGFALLEEGSARHGFHLDSIEVARIWKGGCSLRSALLDDIAEALRATPGLPNLLCDEDLAEKLMAHQESLRHAVWRSGEFDTEVPGLLASLDYLDSRRDAWLPVNLIQVLRDPPQPDETPRFEIEELATIGF